MQKIQVVFIHGGDAFRNPEDLYAMLRSRKFDPYQEKRYWRDSVIEELGDSYECHTLRMPNPNWADYTAWKIWFEKMVPYLRDGVVLVGHSLGASFLLRYLSENKPPVSVEQLHLVSPVVMEFPDCEGFITDLSTWDGFKTDSKEVHLWHSTDDTIVPISHSERLKELYPMAQLHRFTDRFHFIGESFPELLKEIKNTNKTNTTTK